MFFSPTTFQAIKQEFFYFVTKLTSNLRGVWGDEIKLRGAVTIPHKIAKVTLKTKKPKNFEN